MYILIIDEFYDTIMTTADSEELLQVAERSLTSYHYNHSIILLIKSKVLELKHYSYIVSNLII